MDVARDFVLSILSQNPNFGVFLMCVGTLRVIIPPFQALVRAFVRSTPTDRDEAFVEGVFSSKAWNAFVNVIEWLSSVKLPEAKKQPEAGGLERK